MWEIIKTSLPQLLAAGFKYTIPLAIISFFFGLIIALVTALIRLSRQRGAFMILKWIASFYVWLFRSTPLLVQLFIVFFGLPYLRIKGVLPHGIKLEPFTAGIITFSLNTGAYASETIRAAISSVPTGQWEAGAAIGMTRLQILWRIILPQALRVALPPFIKQFYKFGQGHVISCFNYNYGNVCRQSTDCGRKLSTITYVYFSSNGLRGLYDSFILFPRVS
jgi:cystine transport system permease protein